MSFLHYEIFRWQHPKNYKGKPRGIAVSIAGFFRIGQDENVRLRYLTVDYNDGRVEKYARWYQFWLGKKWFFCLIPAFIWRRIAWGIVQEWACKPEEEKKLKLNRKPEKFPTPKSRTKPDGE